MFRTNGTRRLTAAMVLPSVALAHAAWPSLALNQEATPLGPATTAAEGEGRKTPLPPVPGWVPDARLYFLEVDRFVNGDKSNDPPGVAEWTPGVPLETSPADAEDADSDGPSTMLEVERRVYGGDLRGLSTHLDYLEELAVNVLILDPIFQGTGSHPKSVADPRHIDDVFGRRESLKAVVGETDDPSTWQFSQTDRLLLQFVKTAHERGFRVVLSGLFGDVAHGVPVAPNTEDTVMAVTRRWLDPDGDGDPSDGIDGWFVHFPANEPLEFWPKWQSLVKSINPTAALIYVDSSGVPSKTIRQSFDAFIDVNASRAIRNFFWPGRDEPTLGEFLASLESRHTTAEDRERPAALTVLSDVMGPRLLTTMDLDRPNAAGGASPARIRPGEDAVDRWRLATILQHFYTASPITYYGDEVGMYGACRPWPRPPMWWLKPPPGGEKARDYRGDLFALVRWLHDQRVRYAPLTRGKLGSVFQDEEKKVFAVSRSLPGEDVILVMNYGDKKQKIMLPVGNPGTMVGLLSPNVKPAPARKTVPASAPKPQAAKDSSAKTADAPQVTEHLDYSHIRRIRMGGSRQYVNENGNVVVWVSPMSIRVVLVNSDEPWRRQHE